MTDSHSGGTPEKNQADGASSLVSLIDSIASRPAASSALVKQLWSVREVLVATYPEDAPFLTVLMRTQGRRLEAFGDALLCLAAQTDTSFHVVVLAHDADEADLLALRAVVDGQPASFRSRIEVVEVNGGRRATPLNVGISRIRGHYVAVFDDDDVLFANWVEAFAEAAPKAEGRMLRSLVATQVAVPELWPQDQDGFRSKTWPAANYARRFELLDHLIVNHSPFMSWAFPARLFTLLGVRFDEELAVCEDWDVILQGALLMGVQEVDLLTSIYRRWEGASSSYTVHAPDEWRSSERRVVDRLNSTATLLPPGSIERIRQRSTDVGGAHATDLANQLHAIHSSRSWRLIQQVRHVLVPTRRLAGRTLRALHLRK